MKTRFASFKVPIVMLLIEMILPWVVKFLLVLTAKRPLLEEFQATSSCFLKKRENMGLKHLGPESLGHD